MKYCFHFLWSYCHHLGTSAELLLPAVVHDVTQHLRVVTTVGGHLSEHVGTGGYSDNWNVRTTEAWQSTEGVQIILAHVTETVRGVSWSASAELLTCCCHCVQCISWLYGSASELLDTAYVASARMRTTVSRCSVSISCGKLVVPSGWVWQLLSLLLQSLPCP